MVELTPADIADARECQMSNHESQTRRPPASLLPILHDRLGRCWNCQPGVLVWMQEPNQPNILGGFCTECFDQYSARMSPDRTRIESVSIVELGPAVVSEIVDGVAADLAKQLLPKATAGVMP